MGPDARKAFEHKDANGPGLDMLYVKPDCQCRRVCSLQLYKCREGQFKWNGDAKKPDVQGSVGYHKPGGPRVSLPLSHSERRGRVLRGQRTPCRRDASAVVGGILLSRPGGKRAAGEGAGGKGGRWEIMGKKIRRSMLPGSDGWFIKPCDDCPNGKGAYFLREGVWRLTDGDETNPTLLPSVICPARRCHSYVRNGEHHHLSDSKYPNEVRAMREFAEGE